jgi:hypothetical protein
MSGARPDRRVLKSMNRRENTGKAAMRRHRPTKRSCGPPSRHHHRDEQRAGFGRTARISRTSTAEPANRLPPAAHADDSRPMPTYAVQPPFDQLLATAEQVARERPEVDLELAREIFLEAATLLDNGLALEGLDEHDAAAVVAGLCRALVAPDPAAAIRASAAAALEEPGDLHDPATASGSYLVAARILQL